MRCWLALGCLMCALVSGEAALAAPPNAEQKAAAEALFEEAKELRSAGRCADAIPKFEQSVALDVGVGTLLRLADCYEQVGRLASAWANFRHAASLATEQEDGRRAGIATDRAKALDARLARVRIDFGSNAGVPGLLVRRGPIALAAASNGVAVPVDAGTLSIVATAPGHRPIRLEVAVADGEQKAFVLPPLVREDAPASPEPLRSEAPEVKERVVYRYGQRVAALVLGVGSLGTGVVSAVLLGAAAARDAEADLHCTGVVCRDLEGEELSHEALTLANLATAGFVVAAAAGVGALTLFLTAPAYETIVVTPVASPTTAGVEVRLRW